MRSLPLERRQLDLAKPGVKGGIQSNAPGDGFRRGAGAGEGAGIEGIKVFPRESRGTTGGLLTAQGCEFGVVHGAAAGLPVGLSVSNQYDFHRRLGVSFQAEAVPAFECRAVPRSRRI